MRRVPQNQPESQRPSSIQTRIKTLQFKRIQEKHASLKVRDHLPFKQGLRRKM